MNDVSILTSNGVNVQSSLELLGDMEMYNETLSDFLDMVDEKKTNLEKFRAESDMPNYAIAIHALKSDARYLGFLELGDLAYDSELKAKAGDQAGVEANHQNIMNHVDQMVNIANQYLGRTSAPAADATQAPVVDPNAQAGVQPQAPVQPTMAAQPAQPQVQMPAPGMPGAMPNPGMPGAVPQAMPGQAGMGAYQPGMPMPGVMPQNQVYDLSTGQMVSQATPGQPYNSPMQQGMPGMMGTYPNQMYNQYPNQMPGYPQGQYPQPQANMGGYDPMSAALYQQQAMGQYMQNPALMPKQGTILVVDDSNLVANFVKKIFDSRYDVVIANDGAKAIELCADDQFRQKIKACLLDLNMPNVDGYQVLEDFYQKGYFVKMPIAVISGVEDMESIDRVNKFPIIDILAKPFNERDVQRVVEKCLAAYF